MSVGLRSVEHTFCVWNTRVSKVRTHAFGKQYLQLENLHNYGTCTCSCKIKSTYSNILRTYHSTVCTWQRQQMLRRTNVLHT